MHLHPTFHVSLLKPYVHDTQPSRIRPAPMPDLFHSGVKYDKFLEMGLKSTLCRVDLTLLAPGLKSTLRRVDFNSAAGLFWRPPVIPTAELN
jgi:hypothetical protein